KDYTGGPWCPLTPEQEAMGATSQIVSILASTMSSSTTTAIFADNFFSSLEIAQYLKDKNCRSIKEMEKKSVPRGTCNYVLSDDGILAVRMTLSVFSELLADLKSLETDGINVDGETVKGGLYCIAGDNLGSHFIGGFTENFSRSQYFCRYCEITRSEFEADPNACGPLRTTETYDVAVADLQADNIQDVRGIKVNSP
ncbi:hypothetical protein L3Q82_019101, partial [Scortum barcoo]